MELFVSRVSLSEPEVFLDLSKILNLTLKLYNFCTFTVYFLTVMSSLFRIVQTASRVPTVRILSAGFSAQTDVKEQIGKLVKDKKIVVFMKGTPHAPRCGFSNAVVQIFKFHGVDDYTAHDVLADESIRQGRFYDHNILKLQVKKLSLFCW